VYQSICEDAVGTHIDFYKMERFEFYERAKQAYAIVATGETALYGNIILKKGVLSCDDWRLIPNLPNAIIKVIGVQTSLMLTRHYGSRRLG